MHLKIWTTNWLWAAAVSILVFSAGDAQAQLRCRELGSETRPVADAPVIEIRSPNGPFRFRTAFQGRQCAGSDRPTRAKEGLVDESGRRVLVPAAYHRVVPISDTTALVRRSISEHTLYFYDFGVGERGPSPYLRASLPWPHENLVTTTPYAWSTKDFGSVGTFYAFTGGTEPIEVQNASGLMPLARGVQLLQFTLDGQEVTRIFDSHLRPLSPVIGRVEEWKIAPLDDLYDNRPFPSDLVSRSLQFEHPLLPYDGLYIPVADDGSPRPLPEGAIGVFPLKARNLPHLVIERRDRAVGWAVVYPTADGFEIAPVLGRLDEALRQAPTAKRYGGMRRYTDFNTRSHQPTEVFDIAILRDGAGWRAVGATSLQPLDYLAADASFEDPETGFITAYGALQAHVRQQRAQQQIDLEQARAASREWLRRQTAQQTAREAHRQAQIQQQGEAEWARIQAGRQQLCADETTPAWLPPDGLERYFRECEVGSQFMQTYGREVSPEALELAQARSASAAARRERSRFLGPGQAEGDPWAAGLAAAQAASDASYNAFLQRQNDVYMSNLAAWNSGAQNWRYESR